MKAILIFLTSLISVCAMAQHKGDTHQAPAPELIFKKILNQPGIDNKEVRVAIVTYTPGEVSPPHRHPISLVGYVLEGDIESTYEGKKYRYKKGDVFFEDVNALHNGTTNLNKDKPAKLLVYFIGDVGKPFLVLEHK